MADVARSSRPLRRGFGLAAIAVAAADAAAVASTSGGGANGAASAAASARLPMAVYAGLLLLVGIWAVASSRAKGVHAVAAAEESGPTVVSVRDDADERSVIHQLRDFGWYVADDVVLPHGTVDHIAVGAAGILAVQVQWTNVRDGRGSPAARARIAAQQLRKVLAAKELDIEVVPAVLAFGPGLIGEDEGVKVVDTVAILNGYHPAAWVTELERRRLLPAAVVDQARDLIADLHEDDDAPAIVLPEPAFAH